SNPSTISSTTAATLGTHSSISPGRSCPSRDATGQQSVTQTEDWYESRRPRRNSVRYPMNAGLCGRVDRLSLPPSFRAQQEQAQMANVISFDNQVGRMFVREGYNIPAILYPP